MTVRIILEAGRGAGKSTIANIITDALRGRGYDVDVDSSVWPYHISDDHRGVGKVSIEERSPPTS